MPPFDRGGTGMRKDVYVGGQFFIMGGEASSGIVFDQVQLYDSGRDTWSIGWNLPRAVHLAFRLQSTSSQMTSTLLAVARERGTLS